MTFDEEMAAGLAVAEEIFGSVTFTLDGAATTYTGIFDRDSKSKEQGSNGGGFAPLDEPTIVCQKAQFASEPPVGRDVAIVGIGNFRISQVDTDSISYTLRLCLRSQK